MTPKEAITEYGKKMFKRMEERGELDGITCLVKGDEIDIPERDLERAYDIVTKGRSSIVWD